MMEAKADMKIRDNVSSAWSGIKDKIKKRGGEAQQKSPFKLKSVNDNINTYVPENKDIDVKPLTKEKCKKLRKYLDEFSIISCN